MTYAVQSRLLAQYQAFQPPTAKNSVFDVAVSTQQKITKAEVKKKLKQYAREVYSCQKPSDYWSICSITDSAEDRAKEIDAGDDFKVGISEARYLAKAFSTKDKPDESFVWSGFFYKNCSGRIPWLTGKCPEETQDRSFSDYAAYLETVGMSK